MLKVLAGKKKVKKLTQIGGPSSSNSYRRLQTKSGYKNSVQSEMKIGILQPNIYVLRLVSGLYTQRTSI